MHRQVRLTTLYQRIAAVLLPILLFIAGPATAHEYWLDPIGSEWSVGDTLLADIRNGEDFIGVKLPFDSNLISRAGLISQSGRLPLTGRLGDYPAFQMPAKETGLHLLLLERKRRELVYEDLPRFEKFLRYHDLDDIAERHRQRALPDTDIVEHYFRYSKALVNVCAATEDADDSVPESSTALENEQAANDKEGTTDTSASHPALNVQNQRLELIATGNPFGSDLLGTRVLFENTPLANRQVELFHKGESGKVTRRVQQSDDTGFVQFDVSKPGDYMLNSVWIEETSVAGAQWISLWASLFFQQTGKSGC